MFAPVAILLSLSIGSAGEGAAGDRSRLNVVFILADDLGWGELGCYGQQKIRTPNIDRLAAEGMRFTQHYSGAPVCAPARCTLMTGLHTGHAQIRGNRPAKDAFPQFQEGQHPLSVQAHTVAQLFQQAGYVTGAFGKWGLGPVGSSGDPNRQGFHQFFGYNCQSVAHSYYPSHLWRNSLRIEINKRPIPGHAAPVAEDVNADDWIGDAYAPRLILAEAIRFIEEHKSVPFFLYLPCIQPHLAMHPPRELLDDYPAEWDVRPYRGQSGYLPHPRPRAAYAAMISDFDDHVGQVMAALERTGVAANTLVIVTSDNGTTHAHRADAAHRADDAFHVGGVDAKFFQSTGGLRGYKGSLYEGGIRVPLIARLPGRIGARTSTDVVSYFPDWLPTLCDAAGLQGPTQLDGQSLWPLLCGGAGPATGRPMIWVFPEYGGQVAVRIGSMKILRRDLLSKMPAPWEVYDLSVDPAESRDLASSRPDMIQAAVAVLHREVDANPYFRCPSRGPNRENRGAKSCVDRSYI